MPRTPKRPVYFWPQDSLAAQLLRRLSADSQLPPHHPAALPTALSAPAHEYLHALGLGKDTTHTVEHASLLGAIKDLVARIPQQAACHAFIAAISSAPAWWRDVLPAWALAQAMPLHDYQAYSAHSSTCRHCFMPAATEHYDLQKLWLAHQDSWDYGTLFGPLHTWFVLQQALQTPLSQWPQPQPHDVYTWQQLLDVLRSLPPKLRYSKVREPVAKMLGLKPHAASSWLEAMADCGFLHVPEHPGLLETWRSAAARDARPNVRVEVGGPLAWWQSDMGVNEALLQQCFGHLPVPSTEPPLPERPQAPALPEWALPLFAPALKTPPKPRHPHIDGEIAAGDVYAVPLPTGPWLLLYCHGVWETKTANKTVEYAVVEFLDAVCDDFPPPGAWNGVVFRPRLGKRSHYRCSGLARQRNIRRIAQNVALPAGTQPIDLQAACVFTKAADLAEMSCWHFDDNP